MLRHDRTVRSWIRASVALVLEARGGTPLTALNLPTETVSQCWLCVRRVSQSARTTCFGMIELPADGHDPGSVLRLHLCWRREGHSVDGLLTWQGQGQAHGWPQNEGFWHIWPKNGLQARVLSIQASSSAEIRASKPKSA